MSELAPPASSANFFPQPQPDGTVRLVISGELDLTAETAVVDAGDRALAAGAVSGLVLDLTDVSFIDSCGLRALLRCRQQADAAGVPCRLAIRPGPVTRLLDIAGLRDSFAYEPGHEPGARERG